MTALTKLPPITSMRDINDFCVSQGIDSLAQGMIELPPPTRLRQIGAEVLQEDTIHTYRARLGEPEFRTAILQTLVHEGVDITEDSILAVQGVTGGIVASLALLKKRKGHQAHVALLEPFYTYHTQQITAVLGENAIVAIPAQDNDFYPGFDALEEAARSGAVDAVILCNPQNPNGRVWSKEEVARVVSLANGPTGLLVICDECYADMIVAPPPIQHITPIQSGVHENVVVCRGFSKTLGCQSWRVGYAVSAPSTIMDLMAAMDPVYICTPLLQHALARYLSGNWDDFTAHVDALKDLLRENWALLSDAFAVRFDWVPIPPEGTMYGMFRHSEATDLAAAEKALCAGVGVCPGSMFVGKEAGETGTIRIHCGISKEKALRIAKTLREGGNK